MKISMSHPSSSSDRAEAKEGKVKLEKLSVIDTAITTATTATATGTANGNVTPSSPRRHWMKLGARSRSVENMLPLATESPTMARRSKSPPFALASGSPGFPGSDSQLIPISPLDMPPKKAWEHNFRSFLSRRSQHPTSFPPAPFIVPLHHQHQHQMPDPSKGNQPVQLQKSLSAGSATTGASNNAANNNTKPAKDDSSDQSVRGGKFFQSIFGGSSHAQKPRRRKTKSLNELDEPMRNGVEKNYSPGNSRCRRVYSQANVESGSNHHHGTGGSVHDDDALDQTLRRASYAGTSNGTAIVPPPLQQPHHIHPQEAHLLPPHHYPYFTQQQQLDSICPLPATTTTTDYIPYSTIQAKAHSMSSLHRQQHQLPPYLPQSHHYYQQQQQQPLLHPNPLGPPPPNIYHSPHPSGSSSQYSMSPSSATTEIKKAFTEFHNSSRYARDSTSPYLGDEPSTRDGDYGDHCSMYNPGLVAQTSFAGPYARNYSNGYNTGNVGAHRFLSSSLPTVDENVSIHKSMRMLRPFQTVECWQSGRRYLIGPAALAACPLLQGLSSISLSSSNNARGAEDRHDERNTDNEEKAMEEPNDMESALDKVEEKESGADNIRHSDNHDESFSSPSELPPLFGCIVLGKALLSYVVQEPIQHLQQRWWSSCILVLRQNYLLEYDQQTGDVLRGLPRGYAHLQYSKSYPNPDFLDALELEFFVSPCARADKRVLTIRLEEARERRDNWIAFLNRAAKLDVKDLYDYDESAEVGRGRYATVYPARRRGQSSNDGGLQASSTERRDEKDLPLSSQFFQKPSVENYDCALKIIDKKEFWRRVVKGRERADTLVRETSVQATMTTKCSKIPSFVRIRGFFETSDHIVLELELLDGMDLFQYVSSKGVLSEKEAAFILRDILTVLDGMNRAGLAHRDIKPANCLMVRTDNRNSPEEVPCVAKVADFGMATFVGVDGLVRGRCGTPGYVAPEIFSAGLHGGYGNKVDVFSAGVTLYVMLCGYEPFYGESDAELVAVNREAKLEFPVSDWKEVSSDAKDLVKCMMEPNPKLRLSAREALQHRWILQHTCRAETTINGVEAPSHPPHKRNDSCVVS